MSICEYLKKIIDIPSPTGTEQRLCHEMQTDLQNWGFSTRLQVVAPDRFNLFATTASRPEIYISSHLDTVRPFIPANEADGKIYGRGACDAKGQMAAAIFAVKGLPAALRRKVGLLFVVGEETDSLGAKMAVQKGLDCRFLINCEPTENKLATGQKGYFAFRLTATGRAAHSGYPENGASAIDKLFLQLSALKNLDWGRDDQFGSATFNIGKISGGEGLNVVAAVAEARCSVRVVTSCAAVENLLKSQLLQHIKCEILARSEPQKLFVPAGWFGEIVKFGSDAVHFSKAVPTLMLGPGSILQAHTDDEFIEKSTLESAVGIFQKLIANLLKTNTEKTERAIVCE